MPAGTERSRYEPSAAVVVPRLAAASTTRTFESGTPAVSVTTPRMGGAAAGMANAGTATASSSIRRGSDFHSVSRCGDTYIGHEGSPDVRWTRLTTRPAWPGGEIFSACDPRAASSSHIGRSGERRGSAREASARERAGERVGGLRRGSSGRRVRDEHSGDGRRLVERRAQVVAERALRRMAALGTRIGLRFDVRPNRQAFRLQPRIRDAYSAEQPELQQRDQETRGAQPSGRWWIASGQGAGARERGELRLR